MAISDVLVVYAWNVSVSDVFASVRKPFKEVETLSWCSDLKNGAIISISLSLPSSSDLKLHLQSTDYGSFLANEASPLTVSVIDDKLKEKMVVEFRHMRNQSYEPLASFMDFIT